MDRPRVQEDQAPGLPWLAAGLVAGVLTGILGAADVARALVCLAPLATGSGVQHVEALARGQSTPAPARTIPVKFVGGVLAIGAGLALGREGPAVHMGAVVGNERLRGGVPALPPPAGRGDAPRLRGGHRRVAGDPGRPARVRHRAARAAAVLAATLLRNPPIHDTLRIRMLAADSRPRTPEDAHHVDEVRAGEG